MPDIIYPYADPSFFLFRTRQRVISLSDSRLCFLSGFADVVRYRDTSFASEYMLLVIFRVNA